MTVGRPGALAAPALVAAFAPVLRQPDQPAGKHPTCQCPPTIPMVSASAAPAVAAAAWVAAVAATAAAAVAAMEGGRAKVAVALPMLAGFEVVAHRLEQPTAVRSATCPERPYRPLLAVPHTWATIVPGPSKTLLGHCQHGP